MTWLGFVLLWTITDAANIELLECDPPDLPIWGGYGPVEDSYSPGDTIHYYCAVDTFIGGNYLRKCEDTGDWTGDTPVCDAPSPFSYTTQTSTADESSDSGMAVDGIKDSCSSTVGNNRDEWSGTFAKPGQLIRVMLFLPIGEASYEVVLVKTNGEEVLCGPQTIRHIDRHDWIFHNCPEPHNTGASRLKIRSLSDKPLKICEIRATVLTSPKCTDPHVRIESGHLRLNRKSAVLVCDRGFTRSPDTKLECVREGVWNRKLLYCNQPEFDENIGEILSEPTNPPRRENPEREPLNPPRRENPDREPLNPPRRENPEREPLNPPRRENPDREPLSPPRRENPEREPLNPPRRENPDREPLSPPRRENPGREREKLTERKRFRPK